MQPLPSPYQETLDARTAFVRKVEATAIRASEIEVLEPSGGSITSDVRRPMRWDGSLTIPVSSALVPTTPNDLLTPFGTVISVRLGVELADGSSATVPFGTLVVDSSNVALAPDSRTVTLPLVDLGNRVAGYRFEGPFTVAAGADLADVVNAVVLDRIGVDPELDPTGITLVRARTFGLDPNSDPWRELGDLAAGFGYRLWYDRSGGLVLDQPTVPDPSDAVPFAGKLSASGAFDHQPANVVVARGEGVGGVPVQAVVYDDDPSSPTYAGPAPGSSPYGRVTRYYTSPLLTTVGQCELAARKILAGEAAGAATWTVTKAFDPTVDPDDVLSVPLTDTVTLPLIVDAITVDVAGQTILQTRAVSQLEDL